MVHPLHLTEAGARLVAEAVSVYPHSSPADLDHNLESSVGFGRLWLTGPVAQLVRAADS